MELPKNITQIGEVNRFCKIYVEDYVISYLKQLNQVAVSKDIAVALYGTRQEEGDVIYLFVYGACQLDFLQRETRHLSQAQVQEIERLRRKYFADYGFQGYRLLNGEMIEGFHICEQGICRYIAGYAQFYEKNDYMLAYMLDVRGHEPAPEVVDQEKYETVKRRQEARRAQTEEAKREENKSFIGGKNSKRNGSRKNSNKNNSNREDSRRGNRYDDREDSKSGDKYGDREDNRGTRNRSLSENRNFVEERTSMEEKTSMGSRKAEGLSEGEREDLTAVWRQDKEKNRRDNTGMRGMKIASVVVFALLCLAGISMLDGGERMEELQVAAMGVIAGMTEQKLPDATPQTDQEAGSGQSDNSTLVAEDKLTEALQKENELAANGAADDTDASASGEQGESAAGTTPEPAAGTTPEPATSTTPEPATGTTPEPATGITPEPATDTTPEPATGTTPEPATEPTPKPATESASNPTAEPNAVSAEAQSVSYTIQQGDTLIGICLRNYGNKNRVTEICKLNGITNPDNIKVGQKILLPQ